MIVQEYLDNMTRVRHYSDQNMHILQNETGIMYEDAVDVLPCRYTYSETDVPIEPIDPPEPPEDLPVLLN